MSDLRLTCLTLEYPPDKGGVARYLEGLWSALGCKTGVIRAQTQSRWPHWWPMVKQCREHVGQIMLVSHLLPVGTAAFIARAFGGPAYILIVHGMDICLASRSAWKRRLAQKIIDNAYLVIANSAYTANLLKERFQRTALIITPGHASRPLPSRDEARASLGLNAEDKLILSVGRLVSRKGFDVLMEACRDLPARLIIIGNGPDHARLTQQGATIISHATDEERDAWYAAADVFALLAREEKNDVEGFGIVYLEAAAAALPIVAGKSGGVSEAVEDGVTGTLVDPRGKEQAKQAIRRLLENPEEARKMGKLGQKRVQEHFQWSPRAEAVNAHIPLVSIVIPVFNRLDLFRRCLEALTKQTYRHIEVTIIDDGSSEDIQSVVNAYQNRLPLRITRQENQGAPHARNRGFAQSTGPFVLFLDADAFLAEDAIEVMTRALVENPDTDVVYGDHYFGGKLFQGRPFDRTALQVGNFIHTTALMRREAFTGFDESLKRFQDWDLWLAMADRGSVFKWIPRPLFRIASGGTMSTWMPSFVHRIPWKTLGWMPKRLRAYRDAEKIIQQKHGLTPSVNQVKPTTLISLWLTAIIILEAISALTIFQSTLHSLALAFLTIALLILAARRPDIAAGLLLTEYIIGSKGALLRFGGDGLGHGGIPLRIAWFAAFFLGWLIWAIRRKTYNEWLTYTKDRAVYLVLGLVLLGAFLIGNIRGNPSILADANGWGVWLLLLPALDLAYHERDRLRAYLPSALLAASAWMLAKTLILFYLFSHLTNPVWLEAVYLWVRRTGVGEITRALPNASIWRIFFQSHIYLLPLVIGTAWYALTRARLPRYGWLLAIGAWSVAIISLSRSLGLGIVAGIVATLVLSVWQMKNEFRIRNVTHPIGMVVGGALLVIILFYAPPRPTGSLREAFIARVNTGEDAAVSRWKLLPVLWEGIKQHPFVGSGFGATLTYESRDPRIVKASGGIYTTYAFEWGWLEHWFKFGLIGIPLMAWILIRLGQRIWQAPHDLWIRGAIIVSLFALAITHIFTPYLNHPLGIISLIVLEAGLFLPKKNV